MFLYQILYQNMNNKTKTTNTKCAIGGIYERVFTFWNGRRNGCRCFNLQI